jgi:hypothetical protein
MGLTAMVQNSTISRMTAPHGGFLKIRDFGRAAGKASL